MEPSSMGGRVSSSRVPRSMTVTIVPRTLMRPRTNGGAPGTRVAVRSGIASCALMTLEPYKSRPTRKSSVGNVGASGICAVESKEVERVGIDERHVWSSGCNERAMQLVRQRRAQIHRLPRNRVTEDQPGRM